MSSDRWYYCRECGRIALVEGKAPNFAVPDCDDHKCPVPKMAMEENAARRNGWAALFIILMVALVGGAFWFFKYSGVRLR